MEWTLEMFLYFNISFFIRMVLIFTVMMKYYHWVDKESMQWKIAQYPWKGIAGIFFVLDILYNYVMTIWMLDKPGVWDETVSVRMNRYIDNYDGSDRLLDKWRYYFAIGLCTVLGWSDPKHCGGR